MGSSILLRRRMPAVSTKRSGPSSVSTMVSTASRVVPGMSCTTERSSPTRRLKRVDFPTFGRPTMAIEKMPSSASTGSSGSGGNASTRASSRSPLPRPWIADTGCGVPRPRREKAHVSFSRRSSSALLATRRTGRSLRWRMWATWASSSVMPTLTSTTMRITSASATARSACALTWRASAAAPSPEVGSSQPPVSTTVNERPFQSASSILRSRVTPGFSSTIASRRPTNRFTSVDLPTFGRPTTATTGSEAFTCAGPSPVRRRRWRPPRPLGAARRACCRRENDRSRA